MDWPGNPALQALQKTPVTTDPLVATLLAIECCRHGAGLVYLVENSVVADFVAPGNVLSEVECEIVLDMAPREFAEQYGQYHLTAGAGREILSAMGFSVPAVISSRRRLDHFLDQLPRLTDLQIVEFDRQALG